MNQLVALDIPGGDQFVSELLRAWDRGNAVLPLDRRLSPDVRYETARRLGAREVRTLESTIQLPHDLPTASDTALVVPTSGSSGEPKGVVLSHAAVAASALSSSEFLQVDSHDHWLACLPLAHIGGLSVVTRAILTRTPLTVINGFDAAQVYELSSRCTLVSLVGTALQRVDVRGYRRVLIGGSKPPSALPPNVVTTYGLTETGSGVVYDGRPLRGVEIQIREGEVLVRSASNMTGYRDGSTSIDEEGWLHTGDEGAFDAEGRLQVRGRRGDVIVTGGEKVWPEPVERVISENFPEFEFAIVGQDDAEWGQVVTLVTTHPEAPLIEIRALIKEHIATYAAPKKVVKVDAIPRTALGKIRRQELRDFLSESRTQVKSD